MVLKSTEEHRTKSKRAERNGREDEREAKRLRFCFSYGDVRVGGIEGGSGLSKADLEATELQLLSDCLALSKPRNLRALAKHSLSTC